MENYISQRHVTLIFSLPRGNGLFNKIQQINGRWKGDLRRTHPYSPYNASVVKHALKKLQPHVYSQQNYFKFLDTWSPLCFLECTSLVAAAPCITAAPASWLLTFGSAFTGLRNPFPSLILPALGPSVNLSLYMPLCSFFSGPCLFP